MTINWDLVAKIGGPVVGALVGAGIKQYLDGRAKVVAFLGHVSAIRLQREGGPLQIGTHSVVIRNAGRRTATNVRIGHNVLPDFQVFPDVPYTVAELPNGSKEIRFEQLVPKKQVTITYLYFPPLTWEGVNTHLETDDGLIKVLRVLPTVQLSKPMLTVLWALIGIGVVTLIYLLVLLIQWLASIASAA